MLLVLNVVYQDMIAAHIARDLHRNRSWACKWLKRYGEKGIEGLKDRPKSGRRPELSEEIQVQDSNHYEREQSGMDHKTG